MLNKAAGMPKVHRMLPLRAKVTKAARLEDRLMSLVLPEAVSRSNPHRVVKASMRKVPVPGPKKPS